MNIIQNSLYQHNWIVPRSVMCTLFWTGVILVFTGMILLVTSKHKGKMYESWGGVLLGLGLCVLLVCLILCVHAYCVMAADSTADEENAEPSVPPPAEVKINPYSVVGSGGNTATDLQKSADSSNFYSGSNLANGRKPLSVAKLVPPPKFGVNVSKPQMHTVRFFLSGQEEEDGAVQMEERPHPNPVDAEEQDPSKTTPSTGSSGGGNVSPSVPLAENICPSNRGASVPDKNKSPNVMDNRSLDRNILSSDCDSLMSVETIIPRTSQRNLAQPRRLSPYEFPDDTQEYELGDRSLGVTGGEDWVSSGMGKRKGGKTFPGQPSGSQSSSSIVRDGGGGGVGSGGGDGGNVKPQSRQKKPRHSDLKSQPANYSSETSPSPGSPEMLEQVQVVDDAEVYTARHSPIRPGTTRSLGSRGGHYHTPMAAGWSITRSFGPSSVTVTPLTAHAHDTFIPHRKQQQLPSYDSYVAADGAQTETSHRHGHGRIREPGVRATVEEEELEHRSLRRDQNTAERYRQHQQQQQQQQPDKKTKSTTSELPPPYPQPPLSPTVLEITESKATVYDNVQYFHM